MQFIYQGKDKARLDKFLHEQNPSLSRSQIQKMIVNNQVTVNQHEAPVHFWLKSGDVIIFEPDKKTATQVTPVKFTKKPTPKIVKKTTDYVVLNKPSGLLVHPTEKQEPDTLTAWLLKKFPQVKNVGDDTTRPGIVHRLDREVSGLMVVALNQDFFQTLKKQFQERTIIKEYIALVHGRLLNDNGEIITPLERDHKTGLMKVHTESPGLPAHTIYEVVRRYTNYTLLKIQIKTGRMHQIRAHLYSIGHSVVGDKLYQTRDVRKKKKNIDLRIFLHANLLKFQDTKNHWHKYSSRLPLEMENFLKELK
ncbi:MAG: RluA family pseudouridine synthase [Patescibacteria group bacterium]